MRGMHRPRSNMEIFACSAQGSWMPKSKLDENQLLPIFDTLLLRIAKVCTTKLLQIQNYYSGEVSGRLTRGFSRFSREKKISKFFTLD